MRIIDKNTDFYDYLQDVYRDNSTIFDRTSSFVLTKEIMCEYLASVRRDKGEPGFVLLQVCNTLWLFLIEITKYSNDGYFDAPKDYKLELLATWKNYDKKRSLIKIDFISFGWEIWRYIRDYKNRRWVYNKDRIIKRTADLCKAIDTDNYDIERRINGHTIYRGDFSTKIEKHIPLLKACGMASYINPLDVYLAFDEYFSLEKQSKERTESTGITDKEKISNHGFDVKTSFRGK